MIKAVIFDMDGLMFDTETLTMKHFIKAGVDLGYEISESVMLSLVGKNVHDSKEIMINHYGVDFPFDEIDKTATEYSDKYFKEKGVPKKKGLIKILTFCKNNNLKLAVATSTHRKNAEYLLKSADIYKYFDKTVCGNEVSKGKPNPEIYLTAANKLNVASVECIVLEDSKHGISAAYAAKMMPIFVPDLVMEDDEIKAKIEAKCESLDEAIHIITKWMKI